MKAGTLEETDLLAAHTARVRARNRVPLPPEAVEAGGLPVADASPADRQHLAASLAEDFLPLDLDIPGMKVLNLDPFIAVVEDFLPPEDCDALLRAAKNSGEMKPSRAAGDTTGEIRNSTSLACTTATLTTQPALAKQILALLDRAKKLLAAPESRWQPHATGFRPPAGAGRLAFELPQVAHYTEGQHFLAHEDAFPLDVAAKKRYQRIGTLLVYLNDVAEGGATRFDLLGLQVEPKRGRACIFFPAFSSGLNDPRTVHTAVDAVDEKWVSQTWISMGLAPQPKEEPLAAESISRKRQGKKASGGKKGKKPKGGFGG
ncbi:unnamed protein product [Pedinophyceae sp. YPF-701]|nr:unnamed protein product [Pedinophyceae sp. YPF-701]